MIRTLFLFIAVCALASLCPAQSEQAREIEEFHNPQCDEYLSRMDTVLAEAANYPAAQMYVLVYEGKEPYFDRNGTQRLRSPRRGTADARIASMKRYIALRRFPVDRFTFVKGGFREKLTFEFWLVPPGAPAPEPSPTVKTITYAKGKPFGFCLSCCG